MPSQTPNGNPNDVRSFQCRLCLLRIVRTLPCRCRCLSREADVAYSLGVSTQFMCLSANQGNLLVVGGDTRTSRPILSARCHNIMNAANCSLLLVNAGILLWFGIVQSCSLGSTASSQTRTASLRVLSRSLSTAWTVASGVSWSRSPMTSRMISSRADKTTVLHWSRGTS